MNKNTLPSAGRRRAGLGLLLALPAWPLWGEEVASSDRMAALIRQGGCVVLIRHALTEPGIGDPPGFTLDNCRSQRLLSEAGRGQSRRIGQWFSAQGLKPAGVRSSLWCRCRDTADEAFGAHTPWPALNSSFGNAQAQPAMTQAMRQALRQVPAGRFEVWITHQVSMTALTGSYPAMGEGFVVSNQGQLLARYPWT